MLQNNKIGIIGLGYVGLPLAVEFAKQYKVFGFDINAKRIDQLRSGIDHTLEISEQKLKAVTTPVCTTPRAYTLPMKLKN